MSWLNGALWIVQMLIAATLVWSGAMKLTRPVEQVAAMWPWVAQVPIALVKGTGIIDWLGAAGILLPSLLRIQPRLTPLAAVGLVVLMVCASIFHIARGEVSAIGFNLIFALLSVFIAWGRTNKVPILPK